jgi:hypothetical protein
MLLNSFTLNRFILLPLLALPFSTLSSIAEETPEKIQKTTETYKVLSSDQAQLGTPLHHQHQPRRIIRKISQTRHHQTRNISIDTCRWQTISRKQHQPGWPIVLDMTDSV